ncbi:MAG: phospholipase D-like domain-containing protein [Myxococcota bacterium]
MPELDAETPHLRAENRRVLAPHGGLSEARSEALLERQDKPHEATLLERHLETMRRLGDTPLVAGNSARLLIDGPASYRVIFDAIAQARDHVNVETYILEGDEVGEQLSTLLVEAQSRGVQVNLLYDAVGSLGTSAEFFDGLRAAGVAVCAFNPLLPDRGHVGDPNQRDHRKQVIFDGERVVSGGINFSSVYSSGSAIGRRSKPPTVSSGWRDTNIEVRGPAVAQYQTLFLASWEKQGCPELAAREYFPREVRWGDKVVQAIGSSSDDQHGLVYLALLSAIRESRQSVYVTMAYFVPDPEMREALEAAARRGVDVKLILPGFSDSWIVFQAGRSYYDGLLAAGVEIYELRGALLHAKTAVVDDVWSTVGSTNLDWRSFLYNDELNTIVLGEDFGRATTRMFEADLDDATRIDPSGWRSRGVRARLQERAARLFAAWL